MAQGRAGRAGLSLPLYLQPEPACPARSHLTWGGSHSPSARSESQGKARRVSLPWSLLQPGRACLMVFQGEGTGNLNESGQEGLEGHWNAHPQQGPNVVTSANGPTRISSPCHPKLSKFYLQKVATGDRIGSHSIQRFHLAQSKF